MFFSWQNRYHRAVSVWPNKANGHAASTLKPIELYKASYKDLLAKFNVNRFVKYSILEKDNEFMFEGFYAHSQPQLGYFRVYAYGLTHQQ